MGAVWVEASRRRSVGADGGAERRLCELQELWVPTGKWAHGVRERGRRAGFAFECPVRAYIELAAHGRLRLASGGLEAGGHELFRLFVKPGLDLTRLLV
jgi:hypothetical protein